MLSFNNIYILIGISFVKIIETLPLNNESKFLIDQRQSGKYNIHLSIKDVSIIEIGGNDYEEYSDNDDYYYDDAMLTVSPWGMFTKPTTIRTIPQSYSTTTASSIIYVTPIKENITDSKELNLNNTKNDNYLLSPNITDQNENLFTPKLPLFQNTTQRNQSIIPDSQLSNVIQYKPNTDQKIEENLGFRASQRNPFDFLHYRKVHQKPQSRIIHFNSNLRNSNKRNGKKYSESCKNIADKSLCQMRKRINSLLMQRLFTWFKRRMSEENTSY